MASFTYTVDTYPMAEEISSVSRNLNITTGAVVAMKTAVIAAEEQAAEHICTNVNKGFYSLIRSQISQKTARLQSEVESFFLQMTQQRKALSAIRFRMERDYHMIAGRYARLFNSLNVNLRNRVFTLDKPVTDFAAKEVSRVSTRIRLLAGNVPVTSSEILGGGQRILASSIRNRAFQVIGTMRSFISEMNKQKITTERILIGQTSLPIGDICLPALFMEKVLDESGAAVAECWVTSGMGNPGVYSEVKNTAMATLQELPWTESQPLNPSVAEELNRTLALSTADQRVKSYVQKFITNARPQIPA